MNNPHDSFQEYLGISEATFLGATICCVSVITAIALVSSATHIDGQSLAVLLLMAAGLLPLGLWSGGTQDVLQAIFVNNKSRRALLLSSLMVAGPVLAIPQLLLN